MTSHYHKPTQCFIILSNVNSGHVTVLLLHLSMLQKHHFDQLCFEMSD